MCLELERWQGLPYINKVKQYEIVLSLKVSIFLQLIQSCKLREFILLQCLEA